jgi:low affinity Fe/Cu permease
MQRPYDVPRSAPQEGDALSSHEQPGVLERIAALATKWAGGSAVFALAVVVVVVWAVVGPFVGFSESWQLVINTGTTITTFLMVFLIQRSQNKDSRALHLKLNELIAAQEGASNRLVNVEDFTEHQLKTLHQHFAELARLAEEGRGLTDSHSIEEAERRHARKSPR